jgi:hypothetical protein
MTEIHRSDPTRRRGRQACDSGLADAIRRRDGIGLRNPNSSKPQEHGCSASPSWRTLDRELENDESGFVSKSFRKIRTKPLQYALRDRIRVRAQSEQPHGPY